MSDDIVTRLRHDRENEIEEWWLVEPLCNEAADEIERLRKQVARLQLQILANTTKASHE